MSRERRLAVVLALNVALLAGLTLVGVTAHSLGVLSAAGDYLGDALAIGLSILSVRLTRRAPTTKRSFGYERTTILAALVNASLIVAVATGVVVVALQRLAGHVPHIDGGPVIAVSAAAAVVMTIGALVLRGDEDLNMRAVLLDTAADAVTAMAVAVVGTIILLTGGLFWLDPVVALAVSAVIGYRALKLLREVADVLLESTPKDLDVHRIESAIRDGGEVSEIHDLHVWSLSSDFPLLSAHIVLAGHPSLEEAQTITEGVKRRLRDGFGIDHATLESECEACADPSSHRPDVVSGLRP